MIVNNGAARAEHTCCDNRTSLDKIESLKKCHHITCRMVLSLENMTEAIIIKLSQPHLCSHQNNILKLNIINNVNLCFVGFTFISMILIFLSHQIRQKRIQNVWHKLNIVLHKICLFTLRNIAKIVQCNGDTIRAERNQEIVSWMTFDSTLIPSIHHN